MNIDAIQKMVERYTDAELAILDGKSITFNGRTLTMENLREIRTGRHEWERRLASLQTGSRGYKLARFE